MESNYFINMFVHYMYIHIFAEQFYFPCENT